MALLPTPRSRAPHDPSARAITCEVCGTPTTIGASYSFILSFATTGSEVPIPCFTCEGGEDGNGQHFCCSRDCAAQAAHACIDEHLVPRHEEHRQRGLAAAQPHVPAVRAQDAPAHADPVVVESESVRGSGDHAES